MKGERISVRKRMEEIGTSLVLMALLPLAAAGSVSAGDAAWTGLGPKGKSITAIAVDPHNPKMLYAGTTGGGLFKSTDGGTDWTETNPGFAGDNVLALAINPKFSSILFAGTGGGVFKSRDAGRSWTSMRAGLENPDIDALAIDPRNPAIVYYRRHVGRHGVIQNCGRRT